MAHKIVALERSIGRLDPNAEGAEGELSLLYLIDLGEPIKVKGIDVVITPSAILPDLVKNHDLLEPEDLVALDEGRAFFALDGVPTLVGEGFLAVFQKALVHFQSTVGGRIHRVRELYRYAGLSGDPDNPPDPSTLAALVGG